jgi:bla regulator protein blaR1
VRWQGISMASAGRAEQRVERILNWKGTIPMRFKTLITALIVLLAIPVVYLTASAQPYDRNTESPRPAGVEIAQNTQPPTSAPASHSTHASHKSSRGTFYSYSDDNDQRFVIVSGNDDSLTMSGMGKDSEHVQELRKSIGGDFIWFRRGGKYYVIRDQSTVQRAQSFWAPQSELGKKQEELGRQQEELGKQQEELGRQMEQTRVAVPDLSKELERLQAQLKQLGSSATVSQIGDIQSQIGELQSKFGESQSHAGESQSKLGEQMGALGEKQGKLGEQQGKLGEQQGKLAEEATHKMKALLDEAIKNGAAQPEN